MLACPPVPTCRLLQNTQQQLDLQLQNRTLDDLMGDKVPPTRHGGGRLAGIELHDDEEYRRVDVADKGNGTSSQNCSTHL